MKRITVTKESDSGRNEEFKDNETGILMTREEFVKKIEKWEYMRTEKEEIEVQN